MIQYTINGQKLKKAIKNAGYSMRSFDRKDAPNYIGLSSKTIERAIKTNRATPNTMAAIAILFSENFIADSYDGWVLCENKLPSNIDGIVLIQCKNLLRQKMVSPLTATYNPEHGWIVESEQGYGFELPYYLEVVAWHRIPDFENVY